ncbi:ImmA/IrrE family metallo-endopeptidase [Conexibacter sp. CPCC 206217]|uniref:ImmA/IrrE family metallo-endopeptidase n=1 Tax=Conexibacter sp. CPCC 206217 TaxID=3064574 RepID=UPI00271AB544|nr:ImmA/IrrE family metallo-endopeptidase [Conexibacter sp. CPCC 206217]MDO8213481.1 ImmA/IrrE family metallo-endopeptidase [Conexibacter sp. CPCC 206217]
MSRLDAPLALVPDSDVIAELRALLPDRPITWAEAHSVAERQAARLLKLLHVGEPAVPQFVISSLPGIVVDRRRDWPTSGMSVRAASHWRIVLKSNESRQRQRFSLAHEFTHVLDDPAIERLHANVAPARRHDRAERICNYFAACLLMPRAWVKHDWGTGIQSTRALAWRYYVSEQAMTTRLSELGLSGSRTPILMPSRGRGDRS